MTRTATLNAALAGCAAIAGAAIWAGAFLLPPPRATQPVVDLRGPVAEEAAAVEPPAAEPESPVTTIAMSPPAAPAQPVRIDPAVFGMLPASMTPVLPVRTTLLDSAGPMALTATSFAAAPLESIGETFANSPLAQGLPGLGASALDGPADAGLDQPVAQAELPEPKVPPPTGKIIALDASEGTKLDPLRQRNWDLNAEQVVPVIKPQR